MIAVRTSGGAFERGEIHGRAGRELARRWIDANLAEMRQWLGISTPAHAAAALEPGLGEMRRAVASALPEVDEECRGVARGLDLSEPDYYAVLLWPYLSSRWADGRTDGRAGEGARACTTVGVRGARTEPILGKTDDLPLGLVGLNVLELCAPSDGYRHAHLHFVASPWTVAGMNELGLAIAMTGLPGPYDPAHGVPSLFALRPLLQRAGTVAECELLVRDIPVGALGFSLLVADGRGEMLLLERTGAGMARVPAREGALVHTNTILDPALAPRNPPQREPLLSNAVARLDSARAALAGMERTPSGMAALVLSRPAAGPIFQRGEGGLFTDFAVVMEPAKRRLAVWTKPDAAAPEHTVRMEEL